MEIDRKHLAVEFFAAEQPRKEQIKAKIQQRVVNFRGMHRRGRRMEPIFVGKT